jgi:TatD DNase family protein
LGFGFRVPCFGFRVSGFGFRVTEHTEHTEHETRNMEHGTESSKLRTEKRETKLTPTNLNVFINTHTHAQLYDAKMELVNLAVGVPEKPNYYSYGVHPWYIESEHCWEELEQLKNVAQEKRCIAIGECGLDKMSKVDFELQQEVFIEQIRIANLIGKPLIIHCVKAFNELVNCLNLNDNKMPVIIHGFNNNENIARVLSNEGYYFSFGKALLAYDSNAAKALKNVGRRNFFLETDNADISIKYIYHKASELLGVNEEIIQQQIQSNFEKVFGIKL